MTPNQPNRGNGPATAEALDDLFSGEDSLSADEMQEMQALWQDLGDLADTPAPDDLLPPAAIAQDLQATTRARHYLPALVAILAIISISMAVITGIDNPTGPMLVRGGAVLLLAIGIACLSVGMRFGGLNRTLGLGILGVGALGFLGLTYFEVQAVANDNVPWHNFQCTISLLAMAIPGMALIAWSLRGATLPTPTSGALLGTGIGFFSATVIHLHCAMVSPLHLLLHHGGGVVLMAGLGALSALYLMRRTLDESVN